MLGIQHFRRLTGQSAENSHTAQRPAGRSISEAGGGAFVGTTFPDLDEAGRGVRVVSVFARSDAAQLAELVARADAGDLKIDVAERRPLTDLAAIHDEAVAGRLVGRTILIPDIACAHGR